MEEEEAACAWRTDDIPAGHNYGTSCSSSNARSQQQVLTSTTSVAGKSFERARFIIIRESRALEKLWFYVRYAPCYQLEALIFLPYLFLSFNDPAYDITRKDYKVIWNAELHGNVNSSEVTEPQHIHCHIFLCFSILRMKLTVEIVCVIPFIDSSFKATAM